MKPTEKTNVKETIPYKPGGPGVNLGIDLPDLTHKAILYGPGYVIGEAVMNLCFMANDLFKSKSRANRDRKNKSVPS